MRRPRSVPVPELRDRLAKSKSFTTGRCPVMKCNRQSMAILHDKVDIARAVNAAEAVPLEDAPRGYAELDSGAATKYVLNPGGYVAA
jgi:glutathione-independent formaldehyde dehydrogenase